MKTPTMKNPPPPPPKKEWDIEWDFEEWVEKDHNYARLKGICVLGKKYLGNASYYNGEIVSDITEIEEQ